MNLDFTVLPPTPKCWNYRHCHHISFMLPPPNTHRALETLFYPQSLAQCLAHNMDSVYRHPYQSLASSNWKG